ncbi:MAG: adenosylcobinamide amidohydrolase [Desulfobacteraceae bacterium]|nr:adenosylcobinamide amidohydrolase [Desulfobacteraceae bacterium]
MAGLSTYTMSVQDDARLSDRGEPVPHTPHAAALLISALAAGLWPGRKRRSARPDGRARKAEPEGVRRPFLHFLVLFLLFGSGNALAADRDRVVEGKLIRTNPVELPLDYVRSARVEERSIFKFPNRTLVIEFKEPMRVTSTLEGEKRGIMAVGNHYFPPPCWSVEERLGCRKFKEHTFRAIGKSQKNCCLLFTGADMRNLSIRTARFREMSVHALVTAGVQGNAMRASVDEGLFYEPGTINIVLLTNMRLTPRAMARAIIAATEAKTAAMQDLDIRSSVSPARSQATGTGTDEVLVVEGRGQRIDGAGGHCKLGELISKAVYEGVKQAVQRQNGLSTGRDAFRRLQERCIDMYRIFRKCTGSGEEPGAAGYVTRLEELLREPRYASFVESAFALSDAHERGLLTNLEGFGSWCRSVAEGIAGREIEPWIEHVTEEEVPVVMRMLLNAFLNGLFSKERQLACTDFPILSQSIH